MQSQQRGVSFISVVFIGIVVAALGILAARVVPTVIEYQSVQRAMQQAAQAGQTPAEIRAAFERARTVGYFDAVTGADLVITRRDGRFVVEFAYQEEIPLFGPAYLVLRYQGRSE